MRKRLIRGLSPAPELSGAGQLRSLPTAETLTVYWNAGHSYKAYADAIKAFEAA